MTLEFQQSFGAYMAIVERMLKTCTPESAESILNEAEETTEFLNLCKQVESDYASSKQITNHTKYLISRFFRNSSLYLAASRHENLDVGSWRDRLNEALRRKTETITYLAPLEIFDSDLDEIKCGEALIRKMREGELARILNNENNRLFYPSAYIDVHQLRDYHFLVAIEKKALRIWDPLKFKLILRSEVLPAYSGLGRHIESALQLIALWGWGRLDPVSAEYPPHKSVFLPSVPFVIRRSDSPFAFPDAAPNLRALATEPFFDPDTGEELGERRSIYWENELNGRQFEDFLGKCYALIQTIRLNDEAWRSVEAGLNFLVKGFTSTGMEQLLWHITAIEAVFGDETKTRLTDRLANRIANSLGPTPEVRERLRNQFRKLYAYRSNLVHGSVVNSSVRQGHLSEARDFAREAVFWNLQFWAHILRRSPQAVDALTRRQVLSLIDKTGDEWEKLLPVLQMLPSRFDDLRVPGFGDQ